MATQSLAPSSSMGEKLGDTDVSQLPNDVQQDPEIDIGKQNFTSVFVKTEPIREEQVQNAVNFLSHPKVKGSPVMYRRSFLEKKGLSREEIDEAFNRMPDPHPASEATNVNYGGSGKPTSEMVSSPTLMQTHSAKTVPADVTSSKGILIKSRYQWYHALLAAGFLAVSSAGAAILFKNTIVSRLKAWIRKVVLEEDVLAQKTNAKPSFVEEAAAAATKSAVDTAAEVVKASQEMLILRTEVKRYFEELLRLLYAQTQEMRSLSIAVHKLNGQDVNLRRTSFPPDHDDHRVSGVGSKTANENGNTASDMHSVRSSSPPASGEPSVAPPPKSYMEIMAMVQRGEKLPNIKDINDLPPNPNQQISNPRMVPKPKPWDKSSGHELPQQVRGANGNGVVMDVADGERIVPWWLPKQQQQQQQQKSVRITEIEEADDGGSIGEVNDDGQAVKRQWVPPQIPSFAMPEAEEAIIRSSGKKEQLADDQLQPPPPSSSPFDNN